MPHVDPDQLALFEVSKQEIPAPAVPVEEKKPARRPRRRRLRREDIPEGILRERQVIEPDEDTSRLKPMGVETSWYLVFARKYQFLLDGWPQKRSWRAIDIVRPRLESTIGLH